MTPNPPRDAPAQAAPVRYAVAALAACLWTLTGCTATIETTAPPPTQSARGVLLVDHGRHSSLVLEAADGSLLRWAYGDWRWYVEGRTGGLRVLPTLFVPTQAALGRRELDGPATDEAVRRQLRVGIQAVHAFEAEAARVDSLLRELNARFDAARPTLQYSEPSDFEFVEDPRSYTLLHNSNHVVADWLREVGLAVRGSPVFGNWRVD